MSNGCVSGRAAIQPGKPGSQNRDQTEKKVNENVGVHLQKNCLGTAQLLGLAHDGASHGPHDNGPDDGDDAHQRTQTNATVGPEAPTAAAVVVPRRLFQLLPLFLLVFRTSWWGLEFLLVSLLVFVEVGILVSRWKRSCKSQHGEYCTSNTSLSLALPDSLTCVKMVAGDIANLALNVVEAHGFANSFNEPHGGC